VTTPKVPKEDAAPQNNSGTSGESSSFREGFFDHTVNWIEMVLADGQVVKAYNPIE
jgi:FAD/FMN-containing dehydrogenase